MPNTLSPSVDQLPWFFVEPPADPAEAVLWMRSLFAASSVISIHAGLTPEQASDVVTAAMEAIGTMPPGCSPQDEVDACLLAARDALRRSLRSA